MVSVRIQAYELEVEISSTETHPDHLNDLCNRAIIAFDRALASMLAAGVAVAEIEEPE